MSKDKILHASLRKWVPRLFLQEWHFEIEYPKKDVPVNQGHCLAEIAVDWIYLTAILRVYPAFFKAPENIRERSLVHELCHVVTQPLFDVILKLQSNEKTPNSFVRECVETTTQRVANLVLSKHAI